MDIEDFDTDDLKDEILKCCDEYYARGYDENELFDWIKNGERKR